MIGGVWRAGLIQGANQEGNFGSPSPALDSIYDLASLTKVIFTSSVLAEEWLNSGVSWDNFLAGEVRLEVPELNGTWLENVNLGELWEHRAGVMPHKVCFEPARRAPLPNERREQLWRQALPNILNEAPAGPRGKNVYSDLGFMLLALYLERRHMKSLETQWDEWKVRHGLPVGILTFGIKPEETERFARTLPTEVRHATGEVNDDKAASLGGVATHSGLFGTVNEVWAWLESIVAWEKSDQRLTEWLTPKTERYDGLEGMRFHGGWDRTLFNPESQGGYPSPPRTVGHLGYTGTALWWHPESRQAAILLTNRVYPEHTDASQIAVKKLRQRFFSDFWQGKLKSGWQAQP